MTGLVVINVSARRQDAAARARQTETLAEALRDLQRSLDDRIPPEAPVTAGSPGRVIVACRAGSPRCWTRVSGRRSCSAASSSPAS